jgi:protein-S-isoprenylcysteine O-methyltransferase Ste14
VFVFIYLPAIELEEQHLRKLFPSFAAYAERVPALWPTLHPVRSRELFRWGLYVRNREYQALIGFAVGAALLAAKLLAPWLP